MNEVDFSERFKFVIQNTGNDISQKHLFLGYKPVTIGILSSPTFNFSEKITVSVYSTKQKKVATLSLIYFTKAEVDNATLLIYTAQHGNQQFISPAQKYFQKIYEQFKRKPGNVNLPGNEYDQNRIAYSIPRRISLVTIQQNGLFNLFPTDLHGSINENFYVDSLRQHGNASMQLEETKRVVISHIHVDAFRLAYSLGKNHMKELSRKENFPFGNQLSEKLNLPLPEFTVGYEELEAQFLIDVGIHRLHFLKKIYSKPVSSHNVLAHIHSSTAAWRKKNKIATNYFLR